MTTKNSFKFMMLAALCLTGAVMTACSDDDDDNTQPTALQFTKQSAQVKEGKTDTILVKNGAQPFEAKSADDKLATVSVKKDSIFVTGVKEGKTFVAVTDKNKLAGSVAVEVVK